ncbi:MAG: hypothetical protein IKL24_07175 [Clostridia bacterium]|nr:hypothetical protein [Clostridia bacterium]
MKLKIKAAVIALLCLTFLAFATGCDVWDIPYDVNDTEGYTVSVRYDANGGHFETGTTIIVDSYSMDSLPKNSDGMAEIALIAPENETRTNPFSARKNNHFLVGWYETREAAEKAENEFKYSGYWDFEKDRVTVDPSKEYTANKPVITLYAAWLPLFELEVCDIETGKCLETLTFNPLTDSFTAPQWDKTTGTVRMNGFEKREGYTFNSCYLDADKNVPVEEGSTVTFPDLIDFETATAKSTTCKLYIQWDKGNWFRIETAKQFAVCAKSDINADGNYIIMADLDFEDSFWPENLSAKEFTGSITCTEGNSFTMKNITRNASGSAVALFGGISEGARIENITFENANIIVSKGIKGGTSCAILAGSISDKATLENLAVKNSSFVLSSGFGLTGQPEEYAFGLVCGIGDPDALGITYEELTFDYTEDFIGTKLIIAIDGNTVTLSKEA